MATERDVARKLAKAGDDDISDNILEYQVCMLLLYCNICFITFSSNVSMHCTAGV
jgi:hypothetical protein